jgi:hypothetical protein
MPSKKLIRVDEKLPLDLTADERAIVLGELICLDQEVEDVVSNTPAGQPVMLTLDDLDDLIGHVAAEANHCGNKRKVKKLDGIAEKIQELLDTFTDEEPPKTVNIEEARRAKAISEQSLQIAEFASKALVAAGELGIRTKLLEHFILPAAERGVLLLVPGVARAIKKKLAKDGATFSIAEVASMTMALAEDLLDGDARKQVADLLIAKHMMDCLHEGIAAMAKPPARKKSTPTRKVAGDTVFQFKVTLLGSKPAIWRRLQIKDCTLNKLHEHVQTAMGWTNSHLHQFEIKGRRYGDPELLDDVYDEIECVDSTTTMVSDILPQTGKRFAFKYEYDFGDGWEHEILFEGSPPVDKGKKYPLCLEGERACPPEDVGGVWGYEEFLAALADPKHEEHTHFMEWCGGAFSPDEFNASKATKEMHKGLPDWRRA